MTRTAVGSVVRPRGKAQATNASIKGAHLVPELLAALEADSARVKFGALKSLRELSASKPAVLYPYFDDFAELLYSENDIVKWGATFILGNLSAVDDSGRLDAMIDRFLAPIQGPSMITAANTIAAGATIARAKPHLASRIAGWILQAEWSKYQTAECRNIAVGHAIEALGRIFDLIKRKQPVIVFVRRQLDNSRNATRKKAAAFLKKYAAVQE